MSQAAKASSAPGVVRRLRRLLQEEIWRHAMVDDPSLRGRLYSLLRVLSITEHGIMTKKMFSQAAALSYASLMSLGPIITLAIMISSFVFKDNSVPAANVKDPAAIAAAQKASEARTIELLNTIVTYIAPTTSDLSKAEEKANDPNPTAINDQVPDTSNNPAATADDTNPDQTDKPNLNVNKQLVQLLTTFVDSAHNHSVGVFGVFVLVFICIQMMISIEKNFNNIWGVRRGRDLLRRIVLYWTVFSLGVLAAFTTGTVLVAAMLSSTKVKLPWGLEVLRTFTGLSHLLGFIFLALLLTVFYRFIPNTLVRWRPAMVGGVVVAVCLLLNNDFSFLYIATVLNKQNLYGSVGIIPILMFGLYVFWTMVLFGGVLTYAVQNANNITADRLWNQVSPRTRRLINLAAFLQIARAFLRGKAGLTSAEIAQALRIPEALVNEGLGRLCDLHIVSVVEVSAAEGEFEARYQPGKPLHKLTLGKFHLALDRLGNAEGDGLLEATDPLLPEYVEAMGRFESGPLLQQTFAELLKDEKSGYTNIPFRI